MADIPASGNSPGGISVPVVADLSPFRAGLAQGNAEAQAFDRSATAALANVGKATDTLSTTQRKLVDSMVAANATAKEAAAVFGKTADSQAMLKAFTEASTNALRGHAAAAAQDAVAVRSLGAAFISGSTAMDAAAVAATVAAGANKANAEAAAKAAAAYIGTASAATASAGAKLADAAASEVDTVANTALHISTSTVTRELFTLAREASRGNFSRMAGSATILAQGLGVLAPEIIGTTAAIAGTVGVLVAAEVATAQYNAEQAKLAATLIGTGAASGLSTDQINAASDAAMRASGQSIQAMTAASEAFASAGVTQADTITALDASIDVYAKLTGEKAAGAQKDLASAMEDPARGAVELNDKLHLLNSTTLEHIQNLAAMGDKEGAVNALTAALTQRENEAKAAGVGLNGQIGALKLGFTYLWQEIGKANDQLTLFAHFGFLGGQIGQQMQAAQAAQIKATQFKAGLNADSTGAVDDQAATPEGRDRSARQDLLDKQSRLNKGLVADATLGNTAGYMKDVAALQDVQRALSTLIPEEEKHHKIAVLDSQIAEARAHHNKDLLASLTGQKAALDTAGQIMSPAEAAERAADARNVADAKGAGHGPKPKKDTFGPQNASKEADTQGEIELANAYLDSDAAAIKAEASRKALTEATRASRTEAQKAVLVQTELNLAVAKEAADGGKKVGQLRDQAEAAKTANDAVEAGTMSRAKAAQAQKLELELAPLEAAAALATGAAKIALTKVIDELRIAQGKLNDEDLRGKEIDQLATGTDQIEMLKLRLSLVGATAQQRDVATARLGASQSVKREGGDPTTGKGLDIVNQAGSIAQLQAQVQGAEQMRQMTLAVQAETTAFQKQAATLGMTLEQADRYNEMQKLLAEAKKDGITLDSAEYAALDKLATGYATAAEAARKLEDSQKAALEATKSLSSTFTSAIEGMVFDGNSLAATAHNLAKSLGKEGLEAVLDGSGPLAGLFGTSKVNTVGGANGGILSQLFGSALKVPGASPSNLIGGALGGKPDGTAMNPIYVAPSTVGGLTGGGGNPLSGIMSLFGGGGGGAGAAAGGDPLDMMAGLFHTGTNYVGTPSAQIRVPSSLFAGAPRLHTGLAPDEYPAILQTGEGVTPRGSSSALGSRNTTVNMHFHGVSDTGQFHRSSGQIVRRMKRATG